MTNKMQEITNRVRERRQELGYSYQELADRTGMNRSTLQRYETGGIKNIPLDKLKDLASALQVTPEWLLALDTIAYDMTDGKKLDYDADPDLKKIVAARQKMSKKERDKMISILQVSFDEYFD